MEAQNATGFEIAVIGMAGRFPGADDINAFWDNLVNARVGIRELGEDYLRAEGVDADDLSDPAYVRVGGVLDHADCFDAGFFGYSPREAEVLDPQQRVFLECAWHAMENAGYDPGADRRPVGVFGGAGMNGYLLSLYANQAIREQVSPYEIFVGNDKDFLTTRVSYKLNLRGPSLAVQTACSSSLVAVHIACQSLISGECDLALAGGVAISRQLGYRAQEGGIYSPDGRCRAFDQDAAGTVSGNGVGIVVLKRLDDALADGDHIDAVIKGSAVNNDGATKVSYTAPQVDQQAAVIREALSVAEVDADSISYVEAHGTGTPLGDPIEVAALTKAYRKDTDASGYCALGSVKTGIGHLDAAAGVAGLIKTVLALKHRCLPASLNYNAANPQIDFTHSPFQVNAATRNWPAESGPRRAGVSSFGVGGTNAHVVLEEAPPAPASTAKEPESMLVLSAKSRDALQELSKRLADHLEASPDQNLADVAFTLQQGRRAFPRRVAIQSADRSDAVAQLRAGPGAVTAAVKPSLVFLFPGQASQYPGMARTLYADEPVFRDALDQCANILSGRNGSDLKHLLLTGTDAELLTDTGNAQPALFAFEYALATLWRSWGMTPTAMLGHSLGELVAACIAGVMTLDSALALVATRGRLMQAMPSGAMAAVPLAPDALTTYLDDDLDTDLVIAAHNAPQLCAVAGSAEAVDALLARLEADKVPGKRLQTSHAFHSPSMQAAVLPFVEAVAGHALAPPTIPFISCESGDWISDAQATDPAYWGRQLRAAVNFNAGLSRVLALDEPVLLELGPGNTLITLAAAVAADTSPVRIRTVPGAADAGNASAARVNRAALGQAWCAGIAVDWPRTADPATRRQRVALPGYPFARDRYRVTADAAIRSESKVPAPSLDRLDDWFSVPTWQRRPLASLGPDPTDRVRWLLFADDNGIAEKLVEQIEHAGQDAFRAVRGTRFSQVGYRTFSVNAAAGGYRELFDDMANRDTPPEQIVWLWPLNDDPAQPAFIELLDLVKALSERSEPVQLTVVSRNGQDVIGTEQPDIDQAALTGLVQVVGQEYPGIGCRLVDIDAVGPALPESLWLELRDPAPVLVTAWRGRTRWVLDYAALPLSDPAELAAGPPRRLRRSGSYAIVGDIDNGLGRVWADALADNFSARLALIDTSGAGQALECDNSLLLHANPEEPNALRDALNQAAERNGPLQGVFYSSPTTNQRNAAPLALMQDSHWSYSQQHKLAGLQALISALDAHKPGFVCVQSSLSAVIGGIGLAAYAAANHQLQTLVAQQNAQGATPWFAISWDACRSEAADAPDAGSVGAALAEFALTPSEVWQATERVLSLAPAGQVVVSRAALAPRIRQWISPTPRVLDDAVGARAKARHGKHERPELPTEYLAPRDDVEQTVARIWQDALGIDRVGVDDNFFELGGHSLLAIQVIGKLRDAFPVEVEIQQLLGDDPTVANVAAALKQRLPGGEELAAMAELLEEIEAADSDEQQAGGAA